MRAGDRNTGCLQPSRSNDANVAAVETKLMRRLSTNVKILPKPTARRGKIEIEYYDLDDLNRIYQCNH